MAKEKEALKTPEKLDYSTNHLDLLKQLVEQKKSELDVLKTQIETYKINLMHIENVCKTKQSEFDAKLAKDTKVLEQKKVDKFNEFANREERLSKGENDLAKRITIIESRELSANKVDEEKNKLLNERLKYEKLNSEADVKYKEAIRINEEAHAKLNVISEKETKINNTLKETANIKSIVDQKEENLQQREKDLASNKENLEALKEELQPKIEEYKLLVEKNNGLLGQLKIKEIEVNDKLDQTNKMMDIIQQKDKALKAKEVDLSTKEDELVRKEMASKYK